MKDNSGRGNPGARSPNPQPTLELKKRAVETAGGSMRWEPPLWQIRIGGRAFAFDSQEMAEMSVGDLRKRIGIEQPPR